MKILVVSSYPPMVCGIGSYAAQQVEGLRRDGHQVDVLSPREGGGKFAIELRGGWRPLRILKAARGYDAIWLHYARSLYFRPARVDQVLTSFALWGLMRCAGGRMTVIVHELDCALDGPTVHGRQRWLDRHWWRLADRVVFHSQREREAFGRYFALTQSRRPLEVWSHGKHFVRRCGLDRASARRELGLAASGRLLVSVGFLHPNKGFDRVIEALAQLPEAGDLGYKIVGSVPADDAQAAQYARRLQAQAARDPRVEVVEQLVSDEVFDRWIVAADYVVLPYRKICSSGVAARAGLYGRPLVAAEVGALPEQLTAGSLRFRDEPGLVACLRQIAAGHGTGTEPAAAG